MPPTHSSPPQQPAPLVQAPPSQRQQLRAPSPEMPLSAQTKSPQQPAPLEQAPPALRQQLSGPSLAIPLSAQTVEPPDWLHWLDELQAAPGARFVVVAPVHLPLVQRRAPQHPAPLEHFLPSLRQQLSGPSSAMPLSPQTVAPPDWRHW